MKNIKISILLSLIFFLFGVATLTSYGVNWDSINHLPRGVSFLHYFLTGKKDYSDLPKYVSTFQDPSVLSPQTKGRSFYANSEMPFNYFILYESDGHPPLSDILSAVFNEVLFTKLGLINDIDAFHVYGIFVAASLVGLIFYWLSTRYGKVAGLVGSLSLAMYPLFWSESHFNVEKDVPETVFWSFFIFCIWKGFTKKSIKWILGSGVFFGLALGTKFNILFSIFSVVPWIIFYIFSKREKLISLVNIKMVVSGLAALLIGFLIFYATFPNLWADPIVGIGKVIGFYKRLGIAGAPFDPRYIGPFGVSFYPLVWIGATTPPIILFFAAIGLVYAIKNLKKDPLLFLFLIWLLVPIARVVWPGANIYGGVRQVMEYIPALAVFSGIGAAIFINYIKVKVVFKKVIFVLVIFLVLLFTIIKTHPNENAYFNFLIGGLSGAKAISIPFWGNTFGAPYRTAIDWVNKNVPKNSKLVLVNELVPNLPTLWVRPDILFSATERSGYLRNGEYALTLNYQGTDVRSYYDMYLSTFLNPVYEEKVDGVPLVTVWKNDSEHLKNPWVEKKITKFDMQKNKTGIVFDLKNVYKLSKLEMDYTQKNCMKLTSGIIQISQDNLKWKILPDKLPDDWAISYLGEQPKDGHFIEPFAGLQARYVKFDMSPNNTCLLKNITSIRFSYLE